MFLIRAIVFWYLRTFPQVVDESFGLFDKLGFEEKIKQNDWQYVENQMSQLAPNEFSRVMAQLCSGKILTKEIESFIASTDSEFRNLIAGYYFINVAYIKRGFGWSKDLSEEQINGMNEYLGKSANELTKEYENDVYRAEANGQMIGVVLNFGDKDEAVDYLNNAISIYPDHWLSHIRYFRIVVPRWGGSNEEMYSYIANASDLSIRNMLRVLTLIEIFSDLTYQYDEDDDAIMHFQTEHKELIDEALHQKYDLNKDDITNIYTMNYLGMLYNIIGWYKDRDIVLKHLEGKFTMHPWAYWGMNCERDVKAYKAIGYLKF